METETIARICGEFGIPLLAVRAISDSAAQNFPVPPHLSHLYAHLLTNSFIQAITNFDSNLLAIRSRDALAGIQAGDSSWESLVPLGIVQVIKRDGLFGYKSTTK